MWNVCAFAGCNIHSLMTRGDERIPLTSLCWHDDCQDSVIWTFQSWIIEALFYLVSFWYLDQTKQKRPAPATLCSLHFSSFQAVFSTLTVSLRCLKTCLEIPCLNRFPFPVSSLPCRQPGPCTKCLTVRRIGKRRPQECRWLISIYGIMLRRGQTGLPYCLLLAGVAMVSLSIQKMCYATFCRCRL